MSAARAAAATVSVITTSSTGEDAAQATRSATDRFVDSLRGVEPGPVPGVLRVAPLARQVAPGQADEQGRVPAARALALEGRCLDAEAFRDDQPGPGVARRPLDRGRPQRGHCPSTSNRAQLRPVSRTRTATRRPGIAGWTFWMNQPARNWARRSEVGSKGRIS